MFFLLVKALILTNIVHRGLHTTSKYTIPFFKKFFFRTILRRAYTLPKQKKKTQQDLDQQIMRYIFSLIFWNIFTILAVIAYPLYVVRYVFFFVFTIILYLLGPIEMFEKERIDEVYKSYQKENAQKDYEVRNINLAQAVINLEKEVSRLKRVAGEPANTFKKKIKKPHIRHYV